MIELLELRNFKSVKELRCRMRPFMVLVGPNGAGKTNIVRALELFGELLQRGTTDPAREQGWDQLIRREKKPARAGLSFMVELPLPKDVLERPHRQHLKAPHQGSGTADQESSPVSVEVSLTLAGTVDADEVKVTRESFALRHGGESFSVRADAEGVHVAPGRDPLLWSGVTGGARFIAHSAAKPVDSEASAKETFTNYFSQGALEEEPERRVLRILNLQRFYLPWMTYVAQSCTVSRLRLDASMLRSDSRFKEPAARDILGPEGEGLAAAVDRLKGHGATPAPRFQRVLAALQRVYPRIEDVIPHRIQPGRLTLLFKERGISENLGQSNVSDGVLHALALLVMLEGGSRGGVLAIEEPENAIHPWSLRSMIERAQEVHNRQVLITTHSETVVNAVKDPDSLFIVENDDVKGTTVEPARDRETALDTILKETGQKLGDLWMGGSLGGVPTSEP